MRDQAREPEVVAWRERMKTDEAKRAYRAGAALCELSNAHLKCHHGTASVLLRGLAKVTCVALFGAIAANVLAWVQAWDPYPFILLNLFLSMLAALQAPVIMMSQNRQDSKDRLRGELDYDVNRRAEAEIQGLARKLNALQEQVGDITELLRRRQ